MKKRYEIAPQMRHYDKLTNEWLPYLMFFQTPYYKSDVVNTDSRGFRVSKGIKEFEEIKEKEVSILIGGSTVFGVGASSDSKTISSILTDKSGDLWLNFGGRAFSSTQEFILFTLFIQHFKKIKKVVILSGLNNLILFFLSQNFSKEYGSFFFETTFNKLKEDSFKKRLLKLFADNKKEEIEKKIGDREDIIRLLKRDIENWSIFSKALNFKLFYVLQPMANWIERELSQEEKELFLELDARKENHFRVVANKMDKALYMWYKKNLEKICQEKKLPFFDTNSFLSKESIDRKWLFVDRAHLNDYGNEIVSNFLLKEVL